MRCARNGKGGYLTAVLASRMAQSGARDQAGTRGRTTGCITSRRLIAVVALLAAVPAAGAGEWNPPGRPGASFAARRDVPLGGRAGEESAAYRAGYVAGTVAFGLLIVGGLALVLYRMTKNPYAEPPRRQRGAEAAVRRRGLLMNAFLVNRGEVELYRLADQMELYAEGRDDEIKDYRHTFGDEAIHEGLVPAGCKKPVHLFFDLELSDPRLGIKHPNPAVTHLPLHYPLGNRGGPFGYRGGPFGYRVIDNGSVEMFSHPYPKGDRAWVRKNYPEPFEYADIELVPCHYDPKNFDDVFYCGGVLGVGGLTPRQQEKLKKEFLKYYRDKIGIDLIEEDYEGRSDVTIEEIAAGYTPFTQGTPDYKCPNPKCKNHKSRTPLPVLAYVSPEEDDPFYEVIAGGDGGQLIWLYCEKCGSFVVTNPCT